VRRAEPHGGDHAPDRNGRLPNPESKPALAGAEPAHDRPPARSDDARTGGTGDGESGDEDSKRRRERGACQRQAGARQAGGEDGALAGPVGEQAPWQQRDQRTEVRRRDHEPDFGQ
jgi:hypothetical protein